MNLNLRIGEGYDVHRLVAGRPLILGGVSITFAKGLEGHSDADVLLHAICDALLGSVAVGDLGAHFPDDSDLYLNISSMKLLSTVCDIIEGTGYRPVNIDSTLVMELPYVAKYIYPMRKNIASALRLDVSQVSVKATTHEKLGAIGAGEGIAARAVVLVSKI